MKKSRKIIISLIVIILIAIIGLIVYKTVFNNSQEEVKIIKSIKDYDYNLKENETELYKTEFNELDRILSKKNVDYEEYAKSIAKLFIIDFYTLNNKLSKNDIGGTEFIKEDMRDNFIEEARSTFYKYVEVIDGRTQELPEVSNITDVSVEKAEFKYSDKTIDENAYKVSISWDYVEDLGYEKEASMIIVKQDKKLYIVEMD